MNDVHNQAAFGEEHHRHLGTTLDCGLGFETAAGWEIEHKCHPRAHRCAYPQVPVRHPGQVAAQPETQPQPPTAEVLPGEDLLGLGRVDAGTLI